MPVQNLPWISEQAKEVTQFEDPQKVEFLQQPPVICDEILYIFPIINENPRSGEVNINMTQKQSKKLNNFS